jgi:hypothetical protein
LGPAIPDGNTGADAPLTSTRCPGVKLRMPVLLSGQHFSSWLSGEAGIEILKPATEGVLKAAHSVAADSRCGE